MPHLQSPKGVVVLVVGSQHQDLYRREPPRHRSGRTDPIHPWHAHIHEHDVGQPR